MLGLVEEQQLLLAEIWKKGKGFLMEKCRVIWLVDQAVDSFRLRFLSNWGISPVTLLPALSQSKILITCE
jgi:hypothetical protein